MQAFSDLCETVRASSVIDCFLVSAGLMTDHLNQLHFHLNVIILILLFLTKQNEDKSLICKVIRSGGI